MSTPDTLDALRRANPRGRADFAPGVDVARDAARQIPATAGLEPAGRPGRPRRARRAGIAATAVTAVAVVAAVLVAASPGVPSASAAMQQAAATTAAAAADSGTATVRITHAGQPWAGKVVRWNGGDVAIVDDSSAARPRSREMRMVGGLVYGQQPDGTWLEMGGAENIDADSGTTPDEYLAAVREDASGATLRRFTEHMTDLTTGEGDDGATVFRGHVAAGQVARETGVKDGESLRVLPFGYIAHDEAADPASPLDVAVTVGGDDLVREIRVTWGAWTYTVTYAGLGTTPDLVAPAGARSLKEQRGL
jgi:hypothetical protein